MIAVAVAAGLPLVASCYGTRLAPATQIASLRRGDHAQEIILRQGPFGVHVGPRSWVRFALRDGRRTPWFEASRLKVNQVMVVTSNGPTQPDGGTSPSTGLRWEDLASVEVNDLDLGKTVAGICAGTGFVVLAATTEVLLLGAIGAITRGHAPGELGITRGALDLVADQAFKRPEDDGDDDAEPDRGGRSASVQETFDARPLFSWQARRRDVAVFTLATEGGIDTAATVSSAGGVTVGIRFLHLFELGVGARSTLGAPADGGPSKIASAPFFRFGLHLDLDAARRVALAVGADLGGLPGELRARFLLGVRVRLTDNLQLGFYPWNPVATTRATTDGQRTSDRSHMNLLEVSWLL